MRGGQIVKSLHGAVRQTRTAVSTGRQPERNAVDTAALVDAAAKRATNESVARRRGGWMNRNRDLVAIGVASIVAVSALKRRREFEEELSLSDAFAKRLETERDEARAALVTAEQRLVASTPVLLAAMDAQKGWFSSSFNARADIFEDFVRRAFSDASDVLETVGDAKEQEAQNAAAPTMI